ncbi:MAG: AraC family transcriptional regulator [Cytophagales bacterium]|nr:AraC family transcriptional regulator [Rhizobacter sp.]
MLLSRRPIAPLAPFVDTLWASERGPLPHAREANLPTGRCDIVIPLLERQTITRFADADDTLGHHFNGAVLQGAQDRAHQRDTQSASAVVGVHFKPGGAAAFFGGALPELRNCTVPLDALWGPSARALREDLHEAHGPHARLLRLEAYLMARLHHAVAADTMVMAALQTLARQPTAALVEPVQRASGCGPTQFIARFERAVGLTPKRYARVLRFHALIEGLARQPPHDWAQTAVEAGYSDQSHLIHEFKRMAGITPSVYRAVAPDHPTHVVVNDSSEKISNTR